MHAIDKRAVSPRELLTTAEVAELLGVTSRRVRQLLERGTPGFPAPYAITRGTRRQPGQRLWRPADIERWAATADRSAGRRRQT
jgi:excisionase family DNA binding protein